MYICNFSVCIVVGSAGLLLGLFGIDVGFMQAFVRIEVVLELHIPDAAALGSDSSGIVRFA